MDDFELSGDQLTKTLDQISKINRLLGGNSVSLSGVKKLLNRIDKNQTITFVDFGCGDGEMLRLIADLGRKKGYTFELIGVDANIHTLNYAEKSSEKYPEIRFVQYDILSDEKFDNKYDIALSTLFLHHFSDEEIGHWLPKIQKQARLGIIINDLHRHRLAYYLFKLITFTIANPMVKNDGLISILRGFKKKELEKFSKNIDGNSSIQWKWAFRYQWIVTNQNV